MWNLTGKILTVILLPFLYYGFSLALYDVFRIPDPAFMRIVPFAAGFISFALFWLGFRRYLEVICTFEHELTHLIVGLIFLKKPKSFKVTFTQGGYVELYGGKNFLVTLAPYFLPTACYAILPFAWILPVDSLPVFFLMLGAAVSFHLFSGWQEFHFGQSDLHDAGLIFSVLFLPVANIIFFGAVAAMVVGGNDRFWWFFKKGIVGGVELLRRLF